MTTPDREATVESFPPTSGRLTGVVGIVLAGVVLVAALAARSTATPLGIAIVAVLGGILSWAVLLRPSVSAADDVLRLRGIFHTDLVPLAAIDRVVVTQVLAVFVGERRFVSPAIGHSKRQSTKRRLSPGDVPQRGGLDVLPSGKVATSGRGVHQSYVESRITHLAKDSRDRLGVRPGSPEQQALAAEIRRVWAWPEIVGAVVAAIAFLVWLLVL